MKIKSGKPDNKFKATKITVESKDIEEMELGALPVRYSIDQLKRVKRLHN